MEPEKFLRVTEILYPFSGLQNLDPAVVENAARRGTRVHKICESIIDGLGEWDIDEETQGYVNSFKSWWGTGHKIIAMEKRFFCKDLGITGQVDLILDTPQGAIILDIKTPRSPSKTWPLQGSAYAYMARKENINVVGIQFLQLYKDGSPAKLHVYQDDFDLFLQCLNVFNYFFRRKDSGTTHNPSV